MNDDLNFKCKEFYFVVNGVRCQVEPFCPDFMFETLSKLDYIEFLKRLTEVIAPFNPSNYAIKFSFDYDLRCCKFEYYIRATYNFSCKRLVVNLNHIIQHA